MIKHTFGAVAAAKSGKSPPHAITRLSVSWDRMWTVLAMNTWKNNVPIIKLKTNLIIRII
jgi:hypothetical protein